MARSKKILRRKEKAPGGKDRRSGEKEKLKGQQREAAWDSKAVRVFRKKSGGETDLQ